MFALSALTLTIHLATAPAFAERFSGDNSTGKLSFDMEASLHEVPGEAKSFTGELKFDEEITGKWEVQSSQLTTGIGIRDSKMYSFCLEADKFPTIVFNVNAVRGDVDGLRSKSGEGSVTLHGQLKIRSTTRDIEIPTKYNWEEGKLNLDGGTTIKWTDFGVPDPSIAISTLYPDVKIGFDFDLTEKP